ncbi:hypothetical protein RHSIM_Rhsim09G0057700 [Rhododendron simsii]|uniref:Ubiquitin-like domain-containing protein n=1 Tax=Rhododendron simsii TaxID=118357 RepID=A0A834LET2_RHOSS|nr:hypothetical protein RHSIM_Rhsim09G0057700 [Rhododendron simsii]
MSAEEKKPPVGDQAQSNQINLKVKNQDYSGVLKANETLSITAMLSDRTPTPSLLEGNEVFFRIKNNTQLKKLMTSYCERQSLDAKAIVFLFDGHRIKAEQTPEQLGMEDGDEIDAMLHQTGGGFGEM